MSRRRRDYLLEMKIFFMGFSERFMMDKLDATRVQIIVSRCNYLLVETIQDKTGGRAEG